MNSSQGGESGAGPTRFLVLGGFLGAGKTSLAVALGKCLRSEQDKSVAIITNDQGDVLVDTEYTKKAGFDVKEVLGGCFCANFDDFVKNARSLVQMGRPDVIIAEPIGTSTNLMASVVAPLRTMYPDEFEVAPFMVVVDGTKVSRILEGGEQEIKLIPAHQLKEAEYIVLSKTDRLRREEVEANMEELRSRFPDAEIIPCSSVTGKGVPAVADIILSDSVSSKMPAGDEQQMFAGEKASLGWYSSDSSIVPDGPIDLYDLVTSIMKDLAAGFTPPAIAHLKVVIHSPAVAVKMSLVEDSMQVDGLKGSRYLSDRGKLVLNGRILAPPNKLGKVMKEAVYTQAEKWDFEIEDFQESCFTPKSEAPSHFFEE